MLRGTSLIIAGIDDPCSSALSVLTDVCQSLQTQFTYTKSSLATMNCNVSVPCQRIAVEAVRSFIEFSDDLMLRNLGSSNVLSYLFDIYEHTLGCRQFLYAPYYQGLASNFQAELYAKDYSLLLVEVRHAIQSLFSRDAQPLNNSNAVLKWFVISRNIINPEVNDDEALDVSTAETIYLNPSSVQNGQYRWQFRYDLLTYTTEACRALSAGYHVNFKVPLPLIRSLISMACTVDRKSVV